MPEFLTKFEVVISRGKGKVSLNNVLNAILLGLTNLLQPS
jgi:hypothetical protein